MTRGRLFISAARLPERKAAFLRLHEARPAQNQSVYARARAAGAESSLFKRVRRPPEQNPAFLSMCEGCQSGIQPF